MTDPKCLACGDCCRDFRIVFPFDLHPHDIELFLARGFKVPNHKTIRFPHYICPRNAHPPQHTPINTCFQLLFPNAKHSVSRYAQVFAS